MDSKKADQHWSGFPRKMMQGQDMPELSDAQEELSHDNPVNPNDDGAYLGGWASAKSARIARPIAGGRLGIEEKPIDRNADPIDQDAYAAHVNKLAGGMDPALTDQREMVMHQDGMPLRTAEEFAGRDAAGLSKGFTLHRMDATAGKHDQSESFYQTIEVEGPTGVKRKGFLKRSNVLERG
jgi:hypothetical protein